jgi:hypothetical protein
MSIQTKSGKGKWPRVMLIAMHVALKNEERNKNNKKRKDK